MIHVDPALIAPEQAPAAAPTHAPGSTHAPASARARIEEQMAVLTRLARIGMEIAEAVGREAVAAGNTARDATPTPADAAPPRDHGLVFARVARAVRMTIALQRHLAKDLAVLDRDEAYAEADRRRSRRMRLHGLVTDAARTLIEARRKAEGEDGDDEDAAPEIEDEIEQMADAAYERLTDAEDGELDGLSFDQAVAGVCRDLGLSAERTARLLAATAPTAGVGAGARAHTLAEPLAARPPRPDPWPPETGWGGPPVPPHPPP